LATNVSGTGVDNATPDPEADETRSNSGAALDEDEEAVYTAGEASPVSVSIVPTVVVGDEFSAAVVVIVVVVVEVEVAASSTIEVEASATSSSPSSASAGVGTLVVHGAH
jgi:hypothetical protein